MSSNDRSSVSGRIKYITMKLQKHEKLEKIRENVRKYEKMRENMRNMNIRLLKECIVKRGDINFVKLDFLEEKSCVAFPYTRFSSENPGTQYFSAKNFNFNEIPRKNQKCT